MPSPFGHALAGVAVAWSADIATRRQSPPRLVATCAALAALPDVDLVVRRYHRTWSHSVTAVLVVTIVAAAVTGRVTHLRAARFAGRARFRASPFGAQDGGRARWRTALVCGGAYASHLLLDWLGVDTWPPYGLQILWPFSDRWFISGWDIFRQTARDRFFTAPVIRNNVLALVQEAAILLPIVAVLWLVREKTAARFPAEVAGGDHAPQ